MVSISTIAGSLAATAALARAQCDCYTVDGSTPTTFKNYRFWDFRSLQEHAVSEPDVIDTIEGNANAGSTSGYFDTEEFNNFWMMSTWDQAPDPDGTATIHYAYSKNNLFIQNNPDNGDETMLTMRTSRLQDFQPSAELESFAALSHASMRMMARTHGEAGACTSIFSYLESVPYDQALTQEADIEILTREDETQIHYTNQPGVIGDEEVPGASTQMSLPGGKRWSQWLEHRLDWVPGMSTFFVDGEEVLQKSFQAPKDPSAAMLNVWSNGEPTWSGEMAVGGRAYQDLQWLEIAYDVVDAGSCSNVCSVDAGNPGSPVPV